MSWEERITRIPGTICKIYLAEITGTHPLYRFARSFFPMQYSYSRDEIYCSFDLPENGVFEFCVRWYDKESKKIIRQEQQWFVIFEGDYYELDKCEILFTLFNLRLQTSQELAV